MTALTLQANRPMTVKEISARADFNFDPDIAPKFWLRTGQILLKQAHVYDQEGTDEKAYLLYMRYANLITDRLHRHPLANEPENKRAIKAVQKTLPDVIDRLEALKPRISARCEAWEKAMQRREAYAAIDGERDDARSSRELETSDLALVGNRTTTLAGSENRDLAVKLAHKEYKRRTAARATRQAGVSEEEEHERRTAGLWDDWESALRRDGKPRVDDDDRMRQSMQDARRIMDGMQDTEGVRRRLTKPRSDRPPSAVNRTSDYRYPSISKPQPMSQDSWRRSLSPPRPSLPPKPPIEKLELRSPDEPPPRPAKESAYPSPITPDSSFQSPPQYTFKPSATLENGEPLRTVFLPVGLRDTFLKYAAPNTRKNLETCGMLCGTLISNALFVSKLVIPEQESTSDTCDTINEGAIFDYCFSEDLMMLGWIHTHPSQTCFMSSRDLHTHCSYQIMMAESIAIVCAPSQKPSWGVFRLTNPPGMPTIMGCKQTGLFHPHNAEFIYTDALRPVGGHVCETEGLKYDVVDLRPS